MIILFPDEVLPRGNKEDILSITIVGNASVAMTALNIPFFVIIN